MTFFGFSIFRVDELEHPVSNSGAANSTEKSIFLIFIKYLFYIYANYVVEFAVEDVSPDDAVVWVVGSFKGGTVSHDELGVRRGEASRASEEGGNKFVERDDAALDEEKVDTDEVAVAQRIFIEGEGSVVDIADILRIGISHLGDLLGDVAYGGEGVGEQMSGTIEILKDKLVEILRLGSRITLGIFHQGLSALSKGER
jgi:hypothetical protein